MGKHKISSHALGKSKTAVPLCIKKTHTKRGKCLKWTDDNMKSAVSAVTSGIMSQRRASQIFRIPRCTLHTRVTGKTNLSARPGHPTKLSFEQEMKLVDYAGNRASLGIGFGKRPFFVYASQFAEKFGVKFANGLPSEQWWSGVKRRHPDLRLRQPEGTAAVRHKCMDPVEVAKYFQAMKQVIGENDLTNNPDRIWNMDESRIQLEHKPGKIVAKKGTKYLQSTTSGNRETITVIAAVNAQGRSLPPHFIVKGKTARSLRSFQTETAPAGSTWSVSDSGWTKQGISHLWFMKSFLPGVGRERPQLLILDGHDSHNFVELISVAIENNIHLLELPSHTSHWLQPCDRTLFGPLKRYYNNECHQLMSNYPGVVVSRSNFCGLYTKAWNQAMTDDNIKSGFRACGIFPFDPSAVPREAYLPNSIYDVERLLGNPHLLEEQPIPKEPAKPAECIDFSKFMSHDPSVLNEICSLITPKAALDALETTLTERERQGYKFIYDEGGTLDNVNYHCWCRLQNLCGQLDSSPHGLIQSSDSTRTDITSSMENHEQNCQADAEQTVRSNEKASQSSDTELLDRNMSSGEQLKNETSLCRMMNKNEQSMTIQLASEKCEPAPNCDLIDLLEMCTTANRLDCVDKSFTDVALMKHDFEMEKMIERTLQTFPFQISSYPGDPDGDVLPSANLFDCVDKCLTGVALTKHDFEMETMIEKTLQTFPFQNSSYPGDPDGDVLPYPSNIACHSKRSLKSNQKHFFLLTSKEAYEEKQKERLNRILKENQKQERLIVRNQKQLKNTGKIMQKNKERLNNISKENQLEDCLRIKAQEDANKSKACIAPILQQSKDELSTQISRDFKKLLMTDETTKEQGKVKPELTITDKKVGKVNQYSRNDQAAHSRVYTSGCQQRKFSKKRMSCSSTTRPSRSHRKSDCCFICGESEADQPTEEWIQCSDCFTWVHEECANVENNIFVCEKCV